MMHTLLCCVSQPKLLLNKPNDEVLQVLGSNPLSRHTHPAIARERYNLEGLQFGRFPRFPSVPQGSTRSQKFVIIKSCGQSWVSFPDSFDQIHLGRDGSVPRDDPNFFGQPDFRPKLPERHHLRWHSRAVLVSTQACFCIDWELGILEVSWLSASYLVIQKLSCSKRVCKV